MTLANLKKEKSELRKWLKVGRISSIIPKDPPPGIKTGLPAFDTVSIDNGKDRASCFSHVITIIGETGSGKTTYVQNLALEMAKAKHPVLYLYLERGTTADQIRRLGSIDDEQFRKIEKYKRYRDLRKQTEQGNDSGGAGKELETWEEVRRIRIVDDTELTEAYMNYEIEQDKEMVRSGKMTDKTLDAWKWKLRTNPILQNAETQKGLTKVIVNFLEHLVEEVGKGGAGGREVDELRSPVIIWDSLHRFPPLGREGVRIRTDQTMALVIAAQKTKVESINRFPTCIAILHTSRGNGEAIGRLFGKWVNPEEGENEAALSWQKKDDLKSASATPRELAKMILHSGKESGGLEYDANAVLYVHKEDRIGSAFIICGKSGNWRDVGMIQEVIPDWDSGLVVPCSQGIYGPESKYMDGGFLTADEAWKISGNVRGVRRKNTPTGRTQSNRNIFQSINK